MNSTAQTIVFSANGREHEAEVSKATWPRSLVSPDHLTVEHSSCSYVIALHGASGDRPARFLAHPIGEAA